MNSTRSFAIAFLALASFTGAKAGEPPLVSDVWHKGHNITEPRPKSSNFMKVLEGGFVVVSKSAGYRLMIEVSPQLTTPYLMQAAFENPADPDKPFIEEAVISKPQKILTLTHGPAKGLRISRDYRITVKVFPRKGAAEAIDVLEQKVRSYVDSTGADIKMKGGMNSQ
jgi:hypothetical protein